MILGRISQHRLPGIIIYECLAALCGEAFFILRNSSYWRCGFLFFGRQDLHIVTVICCQVSITILRDFQHITAKLNIGKMNKQLSQILNSRKLILLLIKSRWIMILFFLISNRSAQISMLCLPGKTLKDFIIEQQAEGAYPKAPSACL